MPRRKKIVDRVGDAMAEPPPQDEGDFLLEFVRQQGAKEQPFGLKGALFRFGRPEEKHRLVREDSGRVLYLKGNEPPKVVTSKDDLPRFSQPGA